MYLAKIVTFKLRKALKSTSNTTDSSRPVVTSSHGSQLVDGMRRSHRIQNLPEPAVYSEIQIEDETVSGRSVLLAATSKLTKAISYSAVSSSNNNAVSVENANSVKDLRSQSSKGTYS